MGEFLAFEQLLAELSASFVNLPATRVDDAIIDALRRIVGLLGVERCNLVRFAVDNEPSVTHSWSLEGVPAVVLRSISDDFPWALRRIRAGDPVVVARLADLPPEAAVDHATWRRAGVKSNLTMPMTVRGKIEGAIALASLRRERQWPEHLVSRLRIIADVFGNALAHKRAQEALDAAIAFEQRVSTILGALLTTGPAEQDRAIEAGLADMARVFGAERATLWQRVGDKAEFAKTHRWLAEGAPVVPNAVGASITPWLSGQLLRGNVVRFANFGALPPGAARICRASGGSTSAPPWWSRSRCRARWWARSRSPRRTWTASGPRHWCRGSSSSARCWRAWWRGGPPSVASTRRRRRPRTRRASARWARSPPRSRTS
jgi:GAF domain-containing protein